MFCPQCGTSNTNGSFCANCGASLAPSSHPSANPTNNAVNQAGVSFSQAIQNGFKKYFDFSTRATRSEYWWWTLFVILLSLVAQAIDNSGFVDGLFTLVLLIPGIAVGARRLHDTNRSGWWQLIAITIIGLIPLIIWLVQESDPGPNRFGPPVPHNERRNIQ